MYTPEMLSEKMSQGAGHRADHRRAHDNPAPVFHPEFGRFMLEATPGKPWGIGFKDLLDVEPNMKWR
jgi:glutamate--cysteine ligase catalytic subunit